MRFVDLSGNTYGEYEVLSKSGKKRNNSIMWVCKCKCGNIVNVSGGNLKSGKANRCASCAKLGARNGAFIHGERHTKLYSVWNSMIGRCHTETDRAYKWYGAKGIKVCDSWRRDYSKFLFWANKNGYKEGLTIDRIDVTKGYSEDNCQWLTLSENSTKARTIDKRKKDETLGI